MARGIVRDLTGQRFGDWLVLKRVPTPPDSKSRGTRWLCRCKCGVERATVGAYLLQGKSRGCGCGKAEQQSIRGRKHGMSRTKINAVWRCIHSRCYNPNDDQYHNYGGRGIVMCDRWRGEMGFANFYADMGDRPSAGHSIDRRDNDGPYSPENCRWATAAEQARNNRNAVHLTVAGQRLCVAEVERMCGVHRSTVARYLRRGWTGDQIVARLRGREPKPKITHPCA